MFNKLKKCVRKILKLCGLEKSVRKILKKERVYISLGENCLADNILDRHNLKSYATIYSHGRSNIEYALALEASEYHNFLDLTNLIYAPLGEKRVAYAGVDKVTNNKYVDMYVKKFEFTHHDLIADPTLRETMLTRIARLHAEKNKRLVFLYHHRACNDTDMDMLHKHLKQFRKFYKRNGNKPVIACLTQNIVKTRQDRRMEYYAKGNVHYFIAHTIAFWGGNDDNIFWARSDDDLIKIMIDAIKKL